MRRHHWHHALRQAGSLLLLAAAASLVLWAVRSDRLPLLADPDAYALDLPVPMISQAEARRFYEAGSHLFIDTRRADAAGGIPGALVVREGSFADDLAAVMDFVYPEDSLILYGDATPLPVAAVAIRFLERGYRNIWILQGGLTAWGLGGGPLREGSSGDE